jgi:hypothetical protein
LLALARAANAGDMFTGRPTPRSADEELGLRHLGGSMLRRPMSAFEVRADMGTTLADVCK